MKHHSTQRDYWRSLEQMAGTPQIAKAEADEFASYDPEELVGTPVTSRRRFMQIMGASMALAGLTVTGCRRWPEEKLAPYASPPNNRLPGVPEEYATAMELNGVAQPLLVKSFDGRPIKIEGNPTHPYSATVFGKQGAATAIAQASVLDLYDPHRSRVVMNRTSGDAKVSDFAAFESTLQGLLKSAGQGEKLAILGQSTSSPSTARLKALCAKKYPKLSWFEYEPLSRDNEVAGVKLATGQAGRTVLHLDKAAVVVSFDADFLGGHPAQIKYAADWVTRRRSADEGQMSRVYVFETALTLTGTVADLRVPMKPSQMMEVLVALAGGLGVSAKGVIPSVGPGEKPALDRALKDLTDNRGSAVIVVGPDLPPEAHQLALMLNAAIGAIGTTITIHEDTAADRPTHIASITDLTNQLKANKFDTLLILGGNPVYDAPADLDFATALKTVPNSIHLGHYDDETAALCKWHLPRAHYLESWGDARTWDGSISIVQPLIQPLFGGKTVDEILAMIGGSPETTSDAIVRKTFTGDDAAYRKALHDGIVEGSAFKAITPAFKDFVAAPAIPSNEGFELHFQKSSVMYDGRFAANGWLQELPETQTKLVWDNAALISKTDADKAGITTGDVITIGVAGKSLDIVAYVLPGQPIGVIGLPLGYGRTAAGPVGSNVGFNVYPLRTSTAPFLVAGATITRTGRTYELAMTQNHQLIDRVGFEGREERTGDKGANAELIREATLAEFSADRSLFKRKEDGVLSLQLAQLFDGPPDHDTQAHQWGMAVDLNSCIGCNACVIACQAENNIPVVGKDNAAMGRAMHWIRIDRYFRGDAKDPVNDPNPEVVYQPVMCQHCENAPCEQVCPVGATMHDTEGLNVMVYNRCVGTRYCSNNCPYKVRRFNYLDWQSQDPRHDKYPKPYLNIPDQQQLEQVDTIKRMVFNPEVTVRMRGVMEKCTYCVQRIHTTEIAKRARGEALVDGDVMSACQQTCPTQAIIFGDLRDRNARVSKLHRNSRTYALLSDLNTRPRTQYLGRIRNPAEAKA